jgi:2-polyprenyl-3-methyl-5-hydroxy-6-metoxy-1,4-benzoquinol methylase
MPEQNIPSWGEKIWEEKIKSQNELGVIHGGRFSKSKGITDKQLHEVFEYLDKDVLPLIKKGGKIMDAGVGPLARFSIEFAKRGYKVLGVDISPTTLKYARKHIEQRSIKEITLIQDDLTKLDKINQKFDLVFCFGTFGHIPKILAIETLKKFGSKLNKNGLCLIHFWFSNEHSLIRKIRELLYLTLHKISTKMYRSFNVNCSYYSAEELNEMFNCSKFKIVNKTRNGLFLLRK